MPTITGTITDPQFRRERASLAARASHSPQAAARKLVASWPDLTEAQKAELRALLAPALRDTP
ncbi:MAG: hypothetical protein GEV12_13640 [Micromonosporaceae bacterium]|nr:hypothetical protein [Micromonosporaceae bacterium]